MDILSELRQFSNEDLQDLLQCEEKMLDFVENSPDINAIINRAQQLAEENEKLATGNLEMKSNYEKARQDTIHKVEDLSSLHSNFDQLMVSHKKLTEKLAPSNIQEATLVEAAKSEEESETIAEEFLDKKMDIAKFLNQYLDKRIESHTRKFKGDRLGAQLKQLHNSGY